MTIDEFRKELESHLSSNWNKTPIAYDNAPFETPESSWIRCGLRPSLIENASLGDLCTRINALFVIQIFIPLNVGAGIAYKYAEQLSEIFRNKVINGVNCYQPNINYIGDEGNGWFQINVTVPCWA